MAGERFLVLLQPTRPDVVRDSLSRHMLDFVQEACDRGNYVYLACQTTINDEVVVLPELPSNCFRVPVEARCGDSIGQGRAVVDGVSLARLFSRDFGKYQIDGVIAPISAPVQPLTLGLASNTNSYGPPLIRFDPGSDTHSIDLTVKHLVESGCHPHVHTVVLSYSDRDCWFIAADATDLTPTKRARFHDNLHVSPMRLDSEYLGSLTQTKSTKPTLLYAGRSNSIKNSQKILNAYVDMYASGRDVDVCFLTQDDKWGKLTNFAECPQVRQKTRVGRAQFYVEAARSHVFMNWSESESFHASFREAALLGNVCLSVDNPDTRALFGTNLPERFWFKDDHGSACACLSAVLDDLPGAVADMAPFLDWVKKQNTIPSLIERAEAITRDTALDRLNYGPGESYILDPTKWAIFDQVMAELRAQGLPTFRLSDFIVRIKELFPPLEKYASAFSPWHARNVLKFHYNLVDDCTARYPTFTIPLHSSAKE